MGRPLKIWEIGSVIFPENCSIFWFYALPKTRFLNLWEKNGTSLAINHRLTIWHTRKVMEFFHPFKNCNFCTVCQNWITRLEKRQNNYTFAISGIWMFIRCHPSIFEVTGLLPNGRSRWSTFFVGFRADPYFRSFGPAKISAKKNRHGDFWRQFSRSFPSFIKWHIVTNN